MATISQAEQTERAAARSAMIKQIEQSAPNATPEQLRDLAEAYKAIVSPTTPG